MTDLLTRTACGLYVMGDGKPRGWSNFSWTQAVADMPGDQEDMDALALIGKELMGQLGTAASGEYVEAKDIAFACLHPGSVPSAEHVGMDFADPEVTPENVDAGSGYEQRAWTVCGLLEGFWRTVCYAAVAGTPLVAYLRAWEWCRDQAGSYFLLAGVHPGHHPVIEVFGYADPWARDALTMRAKAQEWGVA